MTTIEDQTGHLLKKYSGDRTVFVTHVYDASGHLHDFYVHRTRDLIRAGYAWHVFAYFTCNASGVRVAIRKTARTAERFAKEFAKKNRVEVSWRLR